MKKYVFFLGLYIPLTQDTMEVPATEIPASQLLTEDINNIIPYLDKYGVCVVPLKNISTGTRKFARSRTADSETRF